MLLLCVLTPLLLGALLGACGRLERKIRMLWAMVATLLTSAMCLYAVFAWQGGAITLFSLSARFQCVLRLDGAGRVLLALCAVLWPIAVLYGDEYMRSEAHEGNFFAWYTMAYAAAAGVAVAGNLFTLYIFYELLTLVTVPLVWHEKDKSSIRAARSYLEYLFGGAAVGFMALMLMGDTAAPLFQMGGQPWQKGQTLLCAAAVLAFIGFGAKAAVFPLSRWLPRASVAPTPVTALLHAVAVVNCGVFAVARALYYTLDYTALRGTWAQAALIALSGVTVLLGSVMAVRETHLKRRLAWSTVSNLSYMLLGLSLLSSAGLIAANTHMLYHGVMKIMLFFCAGAVMIKTGRTHISQTRGLARVMPVTFACFTLAAVSLVGAPPLIGFFSKYYLISAALSQGGAWQIAGSCALLISSVLTAIYTFSIILPAYFLLVGGEALPAANCDPGWRIKTALLVLCALLLALSCCPGALHAVLEGVLV